MGIIENGTLSGTLPSKEVFIVHYPGYPSSIFHAIETLGGNEGIATSRGPMSNKLELRFRCEDPHAHPASGELSLCNSFLLKLSKKKSFDDAQAEFQHLNQLEKSQPVAATNDAPGDRTNVCADVFARVSQSYHFNGMADYQHVIPIHADVAHWKKRKRIEMESLAENSDLMDLADEDVMMLLPPLFAPKDVPENLVLRPPAASGSKRKEEMIAQNLYEVDIEPGYAIDFQVNEIPKKLNWEEFIDGESEQWQWQVAVSELFDERPIWPRESLTQRLLDKDLKCSHHMLNRFLLRAAYYFSGGPFFRFWIRRGYDPRKDPESRLYQRMEFRVPPELRSYCDANASNKSKPRWDDICAFKVFPFKCQTFLQLFELDDDYIQQEIRKPPKQTVCNYRAGWFSESMLDTLRLRVVARFISAYPETGVEELLKSTMEEFEKSKQMCMHKDSLKPDQEKHRQINKGHEDKEKGKIVDEDKEDDAIQMDADDEDLYEYEELNLAADDDESSLQSHAYLDLENNSRTYLEELFHSFPMSEAGLSRMYDGDGSDGEYQMYEQDCDRSCSDGSDEDDG